ncbi:transglycosylase domain-containing protein [Trinickia dinghuensis]|uniref:peptidoglycan glycosyltransferase n=1 Tax=Trinickia dinghuensis TaxID=2291023 RepID=A0A3D8JVE9_9BURK|nr:transglycosylase domain-containing protein [Trinickia dinghuensis]RDU97037.1 glycosyl transferase family 51 [Trinickia dinghuensis]
MNRPLARLPLRYISTMSPGLRWKWLTFVGLAALVGLLAYFVSLEMQTSRLQARYFARIGRQVSFSVQPGPSSDIRFPSPGGPYDLQFGYARLPDFEARLRARGYIVTSQARDSSMMTSLADRGLFIPYAEKDQAGLRLFDAQGVPLFSARYPALAYTDYDSIPPIVVSALTFIEDRYLLDSSEPERNPAIDWGRFARAVSDQALRFVNRHQSTPGGSTLATQTEKFRHSPGGRTATPPEKLRQIASASVRAYLGGENTMAARRNIVVHYLNTVPLAASPGVGEVQGLGDGLTAWYGRDFTDVNRLLSQITAETGNGPVAPDVLADEALAFKQALSLLIAQRAPSYYLVRNRAALDRLTDSYIRVLAANGIVSAPLRDAALQASLASDSHQHKPPQPPASYVARKAVTLVRSRLQQALGVNGFYDLDRLDLTVHSTLDDAVEQAVAAQLEAAGTIDGAKAAGLYGYEMLRPGDDPSKISFSFALFEHEKSGHDVVRVQTDSVNQPFDINGGARLNLGSTAKLRTLITYLQIVSTLHARYASLSTAELKHVQLDPLDGLSRWAVDYLSHTNDRSLPPMLEAAVERKYSASPGETFYTGGGAQSFSNFEKSDNGRILTVREAFQHSVNLVFVRLMRDIVHYEMVQTSGPSAHWFDDPAVRHRYLVQFADQESLVYLHRFYRKYHGKNADEALDLLIADMRKSPPKLATALRSVAPDEPFPWFAQRMRAALKKTPSASISDDDLEKLYEKYAIDKFNLNDRGYISGVHPIALWMLEYLRQHPNATEDELRKASRNARMTSYAWLFKTHHHLTQDRRIRHMVELQAYDAIGKSWRALGYPFETITPSYAAAIGASGDRPDALAHLIGIIANDGKTHRAESIDTLTFAAGTPFETHFGRAPSPGHQAISPEIVTVARSLLRDVVLGGTGARLSTGLPLGDGRTLEVYGKTGTGDQRYNVYARGRGLIESRKVNRTAVFVFVIGNRFYGTLTAYAHEPYAARYDYTSAMAVQLLKTLGPSLAPVLEANDTQAQAAASRTDAQSASPVDTTPAF